MLNKQWQWGLFLLMLPCLGHANISGHVFQDLNLNGSFDIGAASSEVGLVGVMVKAYDATGSEAGQGISDANGQYTISGLTAGKYRLEFSLSEIGLAATHHSSGAGTTLQLVDDGSTTADLGVMKSQDYCEANPKVATSAFSSGLSTTGNQNSLYTFNYDASNTASLAVKAVTGSIWGLAYDKQKQKLFSAAFLKRHVGLGVGGLGGIYVTDANESPTTKLLIDLSSAVNVGSIGARDLSNSTTPSHDTEAMEKIGKVGLGDLEISSDHKHLYAVNLYSKRVQAINITDYTQNGSLPTSSDVSTLSAYPATSCSAGTDRPFALKIKDQHLYLGVVCDAVGGTAADLRGYIYAYDLNTNTWLNSPILTIDRLDYARGFTYNAGSLNSEAKFNPWSDNMSGAPWTSLNPPANQIFRGAGGWVHIWINDPQTGHFLVMYPQPVLSDIEFDANGDMVIGLMDRAGHQGGYNNYGQDSTARVPWDNTTEPLNSVVTAGDIIRAKRQNDGSYALESAGTIDGKGCNGLGMGGPNGGEYYCADAFLDSVASGINSPASTQYHDEVGLGGLALLARDNSVVMTAMDPTALPQANPEAYSGGLRWLDNKTGLYRRALVLQNTATGHNIGKASGVGDIELLCSEAPLEIGNRVWLDTDNDGVQDANESGLANVDVQLLSGTTVLATVTTTADGTYYFSNATGTDSSSEKYNIAPLKPGQTYTIKFPTSVTDAGETYHLTIANSGGNPKIDSNALASGDVSVAASDILSAGANNHSFDVGYTSDPPPSVPLPVNACQVTDYQYAMPKYTAGNPLLDGDAAQATSVVVFPHDATGTLATGGTALNYFASNADTGAVWGMAFQSSAKKLFSAAVLKRHAGLGPQGLGAIYMSDLASASGSSAMNTTKFVDLVADFSINVGQGLLPADRGLPAKPSTPSLDETAFALVGKVGLGDMDIDESGENLYVVNLYDKKVYKINIAQGTGASPVAYSIPQNHGASGTVMRPWALEIAGGKLYAGVVYTPAGNGSVSELSAAIYQMDLATGVWAATPVLTLPLNYPKGMAEESIPSSGNWNPWQDDYDVWHQHGDVSVHPQPIFADLELDSSGAFHLAFIDRAAHQVGNMNLS